MTWSPSLWPTPSSKFNRKNDGQVKSSPACWGKVTRGLYLYLKNRLLGQKWGFCKVLINVFQGLLFFKKEDHILAKILVLGNRTYVCLVSLHVWKALEKEFSQNLDFPVWEFSYSPHTMSVFPKRSTCENWDCSVSTIFTNQGCAQWSLEGSSC